VDRIEGEIGQIHITERQYVDGENILPCSETNFEKLRSQIPVVPDSITDFAKSRND
jgi:hypothetical protein